MEINHHNISESLALGILVTLSGGAMDAYSYFYRGHVFANAQTGNMLLMGVFLVSGRFARALTYLWPILAFGAGVFTANMIRLRHAAPRRSWHELALLAEIFLLVAATFVSQSYDPVSNALISFACGIQVDSFKSIRGTSVATTMCIGNMRSGTHHLAEYLVGRKPEDLRQSGLFFGVNLVFVLGAILESLLIEIVGDKALRLAPVLLFTGYYMVFLRDPGKRDRPQT